MKESLISDDEKFLSDFFFENLIFGNRGKKVIKSISN